MPRYKYLKIIDNDSEFYEFLREKRGSPKSIKHYATPMMYNPDLVDRVNLKTTTHVWSHGDRLYKLSNQYYGEPEYWWVIAWWNGKPTEADIQNGSVIEIPLNLEETLTVLGAY
jgi:nucleoid-associated protein YgaU